MTTHANLRAALAAAMLSMAAAGSAVAANPGEMQDLRSTNPANPFAYIPPQCYTRTETSGLVHNPCYACHIRSTEPNYVNDGDLQTHYDFADPALENHWSNLFVNRSAAMSTMSDADILSYVRSDNYHPKKGEPELAGRLAHPPAGWDINGDGVWSGYRPDVYFSFDGEGFDIAPDHRRTGWRAYGYLPLPGSFLPANGSADDVMIRLPQAFREREDGATDWAVYEINLAIVEALVKRADVEIAPADEKALGIDLDRDGALSTAHRITFAFDPRNGINMSYVGKARSELAAGHVHLAAGLFPEGTEFIHSLRYLDIADDGSVFPGARLKELRYARKLGWRTYTSLLEQAMNELREEHDNPDSPETFSGDVESGIATGTGWRYQGFIEDKSGALRPQTFEESLTCAGCHAGTGRPTDTIFSYPRKVDQPNNGWFHWNRTYALGNQPDRQWPGLGGEYATYLRRNHGSDEFRANSEAIAHFFPDGRTDEQAIAALAKHIGAFTDPSPARALMLDKAYRAIVDEQSYAKGRNPVIAPLDSAVWRSVPADTMTGVTAPVE
jgi:hypothetical protein